MTRLSLIASVALITAWIAAPASAATISPRLADEVRSPVVDVQAGQTMRVRVKSANLRQAPDMKSRKLASLPRGTTVQVTGTQGDWTAVMHRGQSGYVATRLLTSGSMARTTRRTR